MTEQRHTADTITSDALDALYDERDRLRAQTDRAYRRHDSRDALHYAYSGLADQRLRVAAQLAADERDRGFAAEQRADRAEAAIDRVRAWIAGDPVTARSEFGNGYREALRDIRAALAHVHALAEPKEPTT
ncbi:hypothetical protein [Streptomyces flavidovirens]|uniref:hypothetical protein n=1 Tax=Streptomyces flavidovirens TaxID=67298 RepID=UPI00041C2FA5|nr:hypothetical protein [Streptomyces flavidovirens]